MAQTRMSKEDRRRQLLGLAEEIVREQGAERLTLLTLAERAGVSKPVTYNHFGDRMGLLEQLYRGYDERLVQDVRTLNPACSQTLEGLARKLSSVYFDCTEAHGAVYDDVVAALCTYPEYRDLRTRICQYFIEFYAEFFGPVIEPGAVLDCAVLIGIHGASDELARAVTAGLIARPQAEDSLCSLIVRLLR